jgi:hypothetical protein
MKNEFRHRASVVLNVVLAGTVLLLALYKSERVAEPSAREGQETNETATMNEVAAVDREPTLPGQTERASESDRRGWIEQLRRAGVPNRILARVVQADFAEEWDQRMFDCRRDGNKIAVLQRQRERDEEAEVRAALGEEGYKAWDQENMLREANIGKIQLTATESDTIYELKKKMQRSFWELEEARLKGKMDDAEIEDAYNKAYSGFNERMKALLGDERYGKSQGMDDGAVAANLGQELAKVNPSDSQLHELLKAQQQWNERRAELDKEFQDNPSSAAYAEQIKGLDAARDQEYQRVLGTNVFDTFQKEQDGRYARMKRYENNWGLDDGKIDYVYGTVKDYEKSVQDYQAQARALEEQGENVDWRAVSTNLQQFALQTQQTLQNYLGQESFNKMQRNGVFQFEQLPQRIQLK